MPCRAALKTLALALFCLCPAIALGQEKIRTVKVGPYGDQVRIVVTLIDPTADGYKMQSLIIDLTPAKNKGEQPSSVHVDLTSTVRTVGTGKKEQQILVLRWQGTGEAESKCDGKWTKPDGTETAQIVETVKAVIGKVPLATKTPIDASLPEELEQKVAAVLDSLRSKTLPCVRVTNEARF